MTSIKYGLDFFFIVHKFFFYVRRYSEILIPQDETALYWTSSSSFISFNAKTSKYQYIIEWFFMFKIT